MRAAHDTESPPGARETNGNRPLTQVVKDLRDEAATLFRQEVALARAETMEKARLLTRNAVLLGVGAVFGFAALLFLMVAMSCGLYVGLVAAGLTHMTAGWLAPLLIGVFFGIVGYALIHKGLAMLKSEPLAPEKTIRSLQENKEWIRSKITSPPAG
jgi:hypothetical protein